MQESSSRWELSNSEGYEVDRRPLCEGTSFVLTDASHPRLVLKQGSHFLVLDEAGHIPSCNTLGYGYYRHDTRHLSQWDLFLNDIPLSLLSADVQRGYGGSFLYTNPDTGDIPQQKLIVERQIILDDLLWERIEIENFGSQAYNISLQMKFQSDFADMFEVRGLNRKERGERMLPITRYDGKALFLAYRGVDGMLLETVIDFYGHQPNKITDGIATFNIHLPVREVVEIQLCMVTKWGGQSIGCNEPKIGLQASQDAADEKYQQWHKGVASINTEHELFNVTIERCFNDIYMLRQPTPKGYGLAAGIPWYCSVFGRDSAIAGLQILPFMPEVAKECIEVLAAYQGQKTDTYRAERAGKIMHELRLGELARTNQIPHSPYYGSVDATQLWLMLFCEYIKWTGDLEFAHRYWPSVKLALLFLDKSMEQGNGYMYYKRESPDGLENQGWKDSSDSIMNISGELSQAPIAVCEAQAYVYAAYSEVAKVAELLGHKQMSKRLLKDAASLKERFQRDFWMESEQYVALALDGTGKQANAISSNAGHCLWTGILDIDKAQSVADRIMNPELHSGWGIRTLSSNMLAFNPMSYHNGSVWPHDNAIIGEGLRKIGRIQEMKKVMQDITEVSFYYSDNRLPELFCGFERVGAYKPVCYPISCSPQAWAAGSLLQIIKASLNFQPDALNNTLRIVDPVLPDWLGQVTIKNLKVGNVDMDLLFEIQNGSTYTKILRKSGKMRVIVEN